MSMQYINFEDFLFSSAINYVGLSSEIDVEILIEVFL